MRDASKFSLSTDPEIKVSNQVLDFIPYQARIEILNAIIRREMFLFLECRSTSQFPLSSRFKWFITVLPPDPTAKSMNESVLFFKLFSACCIVRASV